MHVINQEFISKLSFILICQMLLFTFRLAELSYLSYMKIRARKSVSVSTNRANSFIQIDKKKIVLSINMQSFTLTEHWLIILYKHKLRSVLTLCEILELSNINVHEKPLYTMGPTGACLHALHVYSCIYIKLTFFKNCRLKALYKHINITRKWWDVSWHGLHGF